MRKEPHANYCGAKTRSGKPCKNRAMNNGRCRMHGGKSTGAPPAKLIGKQNAKKHGLFAKYLPPETLEIMNDIDTISPIDILWTNIKMQFASIIRAQQIMYVEDKDDTTKELSKLMVENEKGGTQIPVLKEYDIQHAWDKQATFMQSLSRSMAELRNMIKQFYELADYDDYRLLELEKMKAGIEKTNAEIAKTKAETQNEEETTNITIIDKWTDSNED